MGAEERTGAHLPPAIGTIGFQILLTGRNDDEDDAVPPQGAQGPFNEAELSEGLINRVRSTAPQQRRLVPPAEGERRRSGLRAGRRLGD
jgi:hypothetical protein